MQQRQFGNTGRSVSEIGFGAWAIGGSWGDVSDKDAEAALHAALDAGVNFLDTADVYGDGRSERLIARVLKQRGRDGIMVATKAGRKINPHVSAGYTPQVLEQYIDDSLRNLEVDALDLVQLHCPPTDVFYRPEIFEALDKLVTKGKLKAYGVSVEKVEEAIKALEFPISSVQIIFNMFRQRPAEHFFARARAQHVAIIARVPLASGLLTGKLSASSQFAAEDHRNFNRHGEAFDVGETFSGVPYETGLKAVDALRNVIGDVPMAQMALRWILMFDAITVAIPGAKNPTQAASNAAAAHLPALTDAQMSAVADIYTQYIKPHVHQRW
ncbi:aryl-alcohol dehydrogenase-like predicted oxidoreductase [Silvimonas terrae]|uniref:Aryl-alcohol dehydrogenase-like predicted oxidoreductase n=1 Tax=Silvimonas terrae TaxID=300266 RepID=A0A840RBK3_9NEIS|nr:aldo/keto reductase [Silvimonas terrae]MBB5189730.1 aryl-alcohol dehydrogenase-like predicted oxidoreductase [Silvimonas terrae]